MKKRIKKSYSTNHRVPIKEMKIVINMSMRQKEKEKWKIKSTETFQD